MHQAHPDPRPVHDVPTRARVHPPLVAVALAILAAAALLALATPPAAGAATGDYSVRVGGTDQPGWFSYLSGGRYTAARNRIGTRAGTYPDGSYRFWRLAAAGQGTTVTGGQLTVRSVLPDSYVQARVTTGTAGGTTRTLLQTTASRYVTLQVPAGQEWVQAELRTRLPFTTTATDRWLLTLHGGRLYLNDYIDPRARFEEAPPAATWQPDGCVPLRLRGTDQGSGVDRIVLRRGDGTVLASRVAERDESTRPGVPSLGMVRCLRAGSVPHGTTALVLEARDVGGRVHEARTSVRVDRHAPVIDGLPADDAAIDDPRLDLVLQATDVGSGLDGVTAQVDGAAVPLAAEPGQWRLALEAPLAVGLHEVAVTARDVAGNVTLERRRLRVGDATPPTIELVAPGEAGASTPWLRVDASDEGAGVDPASWRITVNGVLVPGLDGDGSGIEGSLGALAAGPHRIAVMVADAAGNRARMEHGYVVEAGAAPASPTIGGRSGTFVLSAPRSAVAWRSRATVRALAVRRGRPLVGQRVLLTNGRRVLAAATTDGTGAAHLRLRVNATCTCRVIAAGAGIGSARRVIAVKPRLWTWAPWSARRGMPFQVTGRVAPGLRGYVVLEARVGGRWIAIRRVRTGAGGRVSTWVRASSSGSFALRWRRGWSPGWAPATSRADIVRVG